MPKCVRKRIPRIEICAADLNKKIAIQERLLSAPSPGNTQPVLSFTNLASPWAAVETPRGSSKFLGVNINDDTTHIFIVRYRSLLDELEVGNNFILFKDRRFRILSVTNMNEDDIFLAIECTERGDDDKDANEA